MLLHVVRGPTSFADLNTVNGVMCETYHEACDRLGLLESDAHWDSALAEAAASQLPHQIRHLFAILLTMCAVFNPLQLWEKYQKYVSEDILRTLQIQHPGLSLDFSDNIDNRALQLLEVMCLSMSGKSLHLGLPSPTRDLPTNQLCTEILRETNYSIEELVLHLSLNEPLLVPDQRAAYNAILHHIEDNKGGIFFLDAPSGTGKTFILNLLLAKIRQRKQIALAVTLLGIASTLLRGGRTVHSAFKYPLTCTCLQCPEVMEPFAGNMASISQ
jgi:hypothetical protein